MNTDGPNSVPPNQLLGANLIAVAGVGLVGYGLVFLVRNFTGFIELGLTPERVGGTPEQIRTFSPQLYNYISHLQVAVAGLLIGLGVAVTALAWRGIRGGERWALWAAFSAAALAVLVAVPLHYAYGLAAPGHLGPIYLVVAILLAGTVLARRGV